MRAKIRRAGMLFVDSGKRWAEDGALRLAAALSYYTLFSLAPLLLLATAIAGIFLGEEAVRGELTKQLSVLLGDAGARAINGFVAGARRPAQGTLAAVVSVVALILGATGVFAELRADLNLIWRVESTRVSGIWAVVKDRLLSFAMVASIGFLLLVSLLANTALSIAFGYLPQNFPALGAQIIYFFFTIGMTMVLFAAIFKILPETPPDWRDVWVGALMTSVLFSLGRTAIGTYLGSTSVLSSFGASASAVIVLLWTYYSALILFYGAEFIVVYSGKANARPGRPMASKTKGRNGHYRGTRPKHPGSLFRIHPAETQTKAGDSKHARGLHLLPRDSHADRGDS